MCRAYLCCIRGGSNEHAPRSVQGVYASVHLPRIGHDTPGFNWYGTERLIHKILASKGIPTYIYYYPRKQTKRKQTSPPSPPPVKAAKTATATSNGDSNSVCKPCTSTANTTNIVSSTGPLDLFAGIAVHLYNVESDAMTQYKRFIIAYDGDVDSYVHGSTTHLITSATTDVEDLKKVRGGHKCCVVTTQWLDDCLKQNKILTTEAYTIGL